MQRKEKQMRQAELSSCPEHQRLWRNQDAIFRRMQNLNKIENETIQCFIQDNHAFFEKTMRFHLPAGFIRMICPEPL
jgi:hypothetical protein